MPLAEAAAPDALVGRVVHKPAAAFGHRTRGTAQEEEEEEAAVPWQCARSWAAVHGPGLQFGLVPQQVVLPQNRGRG